MTHRYITLLHPDHSPAILRVDRIRRIEDSPGGNAKVWYGNGQTYTVIGRAEEIQSIISEEIKPIWECEETTGQDRAP